VITVTHSGNATQTYHYTYDTGTNGYGRLTQVTWGGKCGSTLPVYTEAYSYTVAGEVSGKTLTVTKMVHGACVQFLVTGSFAYDNEGKTTGVTYPELIGGVTALRHAGRRRCIRPTIQYCGSAERDEQFGNIDLASKWLQELAAPFS
jgi:hypothetical protein